MIEFEKSRSKEKRPACSSCGRQSLFVWIAMFIIKSILTHSLAIEIVIWFTCVNIAAFFLNAIDKATAVWKLTEYRVPEFNLHLLSGLGGAPTTVLSMFIFNHKSSKVSYQTRFINICRIHICVLLFVFVCYVISFVNYNFLKK